MLNFRRLELLDALRRLVLPVDSRFGMDISQHAAPTIPLVDSLDNTPYLQDYGAPVGKQHSVGQVLNENGFVVAKPAPDRALQIRQITINSGTVESQFLVSVLNATELATVGMGTEFEMVALSSRTAGGRVRSVITAGTHTTSSVGLSVMACRLNVGDSTIITLPGPGIILYGDDKGQVPGLAVICLVQNEGMRVGFVGREWPLPGA